MSPRLCSLALVFSALFAIVFAQPASAAKHSCTGKNARTIDHNGSLRVFIADGNEVNSDGSTSKGRVGYACSTKYGKRVRLKACAFAADCFKVSRWNGRYMYYTHAFVGPTATYGDTSRMIDLKTGRSQNEATVPVQDTTVSPRCTDSTRCEKWTLRSVIGPSRSFAVGYRLRVFTGAYTADELGYVIEKHCLSADMQTDTRVVLDHTDDASDMAKIRIIGNQVKWTVGGVEKTSTLCA
jgi:hypothetical protein